MVKEIIKSYTKMCEYKFRDGERCKEAARPNSEYCILHVDLPEDEESEEFKRINELKAEKVKEKIGEGDFNFEGANLFKVDFSLMTIEGSLTFNDAVIEKDALFVNAKIGGHTSFERAEIGGHASLNGAEIDGYAWFYEAKVGGNVSFNGTKIFRYTSFEGAEIVGDAWFYGAEIGEQASFYRAKIGGHASFDDTKIGRYASFDRAEIGGDASFILTEIKGDCSFEDAVFKEPKAQEVACQTARKTQERSGDRVSADYHFYREMEAKRKQKHPIIRVLELPVQYIFGYGVHPWRVITTWLVTVFALAVVYWIGNGVVAADSFLEYLYFSVVTAATPGYGGYKPAPGVYQLLATIEAIFTFIVGKFSQSDIFIIY